MPHALRCLLLLLTAGALATNTLVPCNENAPTARNACLSRGLSVMPLCSQKDGKVALFLRSEFGFEFTHSLPTAYALHLAGLLGTSCGCGSGTKELYFFSEHHWDVASCVRRWNVREADRLGWSSSRDSITGGFHSGVPTRGWEPPPLRDHYRSLPLNFPPGWDMSAPIVLFYNKFSVEWGGMPVNTLPANRVHEIVGRILGQGLALVYSRSKNHHDKEEHDLSAPEPHEMEWIRNRPTAGVRSLLLEELADVNPSLSYNDIQFRLLSRVRAVVTVQGGTAIMAGYFCRDVLVMHRRGHEMDFPGNEYEQLFSHFLGTRYRLAFNASQLEDGVVAALSRWSAPHLPPGLPPASAQAPQTVCTSFRVLLPTTSRLGDRMLDTMGVAAIARLAAPGADCTILQSRAQYELDDVQWGACKVQYVKDAAAETERSVPVGECSVDLRATARLPLLTGAAETSRNCGACGGSSPPARLLQLPEVVALLPPDQRRIVDLEASFLSVAKEIRLSPGARANAITLMRRAFPSGLTGLHIRRSDKVNKGARTPWDKMILMSRAEAQKYTESAMEYIRGLPPPAFVYLATDDRANFPTFAALVAAAGGTVVNQPPLEDDPWTDFFSLAECDQVVMASKYSTFAMVSTMLRHRALVSFTPLNATLLQIWRPLLVVPTEMPGMTQLQLRGNVETRWEPAWDEWAWQPPGGAVKDE